MQGDLVGIDNSPQAMCWMHEDRRRIADRLGIASDGTQDIDDERRRKECWQSPRPFCCLEIFPSGKRDTVTRLDAHLPQHDFEARSTTSVLPHETERLG